MAKKPQRELTESVEILMLDLGNPKWATYEGSIVTATGKTVTLILSPGLHTLPLGKAIQLCASFPFLFTDSAEKIAAFKAGVSMSSEPSSDSDRDTSTDSSGPVTGPEISESEE